MKKATKVSKPKTQSLIPFSVHQAEEVIMMPPHSEYIPYASYSFWLSTVQFSSVLARTKKKRTTIKRRRVNFLAVIATSKDEKC